MSLPATTSNPFASRHIRPGAIPFVFSEGLTTAGLVERLRNEAWWGQIIGPHGSGKSTLLMALIPELNAAGRQPRLVSLHQGERRLPPLEAGLSPTTQLIVDGYEQLSWWSKWMLKWRCRKAGCGLLVTAHSDTGLPTVFRTSATLEIAQQVVSQLLPAPADRVTEVDVAQAFAKSGGNVRETLFALYDVYQRRGQIR